MAMRVKHGVKPIKSPAGKDCGGSTPKPPKAVAQRASLEAARSLPDHEEAKRRLTDKTVAFSAAMGRLAAVVPNPLSSTFRIFPDGTTMPRPGKRPR